MKIVLFCACLVSMSSVYGCANWLYETGKEYKKNITQQTKKKSEEEQTCEEFGRISLFEEEEKNNNENIDSNAQKLSPNESWLSPKLGKRISNMKKSASMGNLATSFQEQIIHVSNQMHNLSRQLNEIQKVISVIGIQEDNQ